MHVRRRRARDISDRLSARLFRLVGLLSLAAVAVMLVRHLLYLQRASRALATVVGNELRHGRRGTCHSPLIRLSPAGSSPITVRSSLCESGPPRFVVGQQVAVLYDPSAAESLELEEVPSPLWIIAPILGVLGAGSLLAAQAFRRSRRQEADANAARS
jgi:hypothetical protein